VLRPDGRRRDARLSSRAAAPQRTAGVSPAQRTEARVNWP